MAPETIAMLSAVVVLVTAIVGFLAKLQKGVDQIHVIVNSHATAQANRIEQLADALRAAGIDVPDRPE